jgi:hypothetical protein
VGTSGAILALCASADRLKSGLGKSVCERLRLLGLDGNVETAAERVKHETVGLLIR